MLKFDKTVNSILNRLIFEQNEENIDQPEAPESTEDNKTIQSSEEKALADIVEKYEKEGSSFLAESQARYNSGEEYVNKFIENAKKMLSSLSKGKENVNESALKDDLLRFKDYAVEKGKKVLNYIEPAQEKLADIAVNNMDKIAEYALGKKFANDLNHNLSETFLYKAAAIFLDPTGIMSWPYLKKATEEYEKHKGTEDEAIYQLNLLAAQISVIPNFAFKPIFGILTLPFRLAFGGGARIAEKIFGVTGTRKVAKGLANWIKKILPFKPRTVKLADRAVVSRRGLLPKIIKPVKAGLEAIKKNPIKTATVLASGDIPKTTKDLMAKWDKLGAEALRNQKSTPSTLGRFPSFNSLSTQRF